MAFMKEKHKMFVNKTVCVKRSRKHLYIKTVALLLAAVLLCGMTGCSKNEEHISEPESSSSDSQNISVDSSPSDDISSVQSDSSAEFNFDEAVKNITLFGQKISLPCAWSDFGEDFSHDDQYVPAENDLCCNLLYKGEKVGCIFFGDCDIENADDAETKPVVCISIGHYDYGYPYDSKELDWLDRAGYYPGLLEFSFGELTMESTEENIKNFLGNPTSDSEGYNCHYLVYDYDNGYLFFTINDDARRKGRLLEMHIDVEVN